MLKRLLIYIIFLSTFSLGTWYASNYYAAGLVDQTQLIEFGMEEDFLYCQKWRPELFNISDNIDSYRYRENPDFYIDYMIRRVHLTKVKYSPLVWASYYNYSDIVMPILEKNNDELSQDDKYQALYFAILNNNSDIFNLLLKEPLNLNEVIHPVYSNFYEKKQSLSPLSLAVKTQNSELLKKIFSNESLINEKDDKGKTPLHYMAEFGNIEMIKFLLLHGADPKVKSRGLISSLHLACWKGHFEVVKILMDKIDINVKDSHAYTPLHWSCIFKHLRITKYLLKHGADINSRDKDGYTSIMHAAQQGDYDIVKELIDSGALLNLKSTNKMTALDLAFQWEHYDFLRLLIDHGADVKISKFLKSYDPIKNNKLLESQYFYLPIANEHSINTGKDLELKLGENTFFEVMLEDGSYLYTKDDKYYMNEIGQVITFSGQLIDGFPQLNITSKEVYIEKDGVVSQVINCNFTNTGRIQVIKFPNPEALAYIKNGLYKETAESGKPIKGNPLTLKMGPVVQNKKIEVYAYKPICPKCNSGNIFNDGSVIKYRINDIVYKRDLCKCLNCDAMFFHTSYKW